MYRNVEIEKEMGNYCYQIHFMLSSFKGKKHTYIHVNIHEYKFSII